MDGTSDRRAVRVAQALLVALLAALAWTVLKGILELSVGLLAVAAVGGWTIGTILRPVERAGLVAIGLASLAWLGGLIGTWLISMALIQASSRTFVERLVATPFIEWLAPQFGLIEMLGLVIFVLAAAYGARQLR